MLFNQTGIEVSESDAIPLLDYFCWYCNVVDEQIRGYPWTAMRDDIPLPGNLPDITALLAEVERVRQDRADAKAAVDAKQAELGKAVVDAYGHGCANQIRQTSHGLRSATATAITLPPDDVAHADTAIDEGVEANDPPDKEGQISAGE